VVSAYSVEQVDEDALTEYIQAQCCRRRVISRYIDGAGKEVDCKGIEGISCDYYEGLQQSKVLGGEVRVKQEGEEKSGSRVVQEKV
jgi:hypothetical protein